MFLKQEAIFHKVPVLQKTARFRGIPYVARGWEAGRAGKIEK